MLVIISSISSANRILTGVAVNGIDLSGKSVDDATAILAAQQSYPLSGKIVLVDGDKILAGHSGRIGFVHRYPNISTECPQGG